MSALRPRMILAAVAVIGGLAAVQLALLGFERSAPDQFRRPDPVTPTVTPTTYTPTPTPSPSPSSPPRPETLPLKQDGFYWDLMDRTEELIRMYRDNPLHADEDYNQAFLYLLADQMGALRIAGLETGTKEERSKVIGRFTREINQLEDRYSAGAPLGTDVHIRRADGSEFIYDGSTAPGRS